jgi:hypothetical protein
LFDFLPVDNELVFQTGLIMFVVGLSLTGVVLLRGAPDESATAGMKPNLSVQRG